MFTPKNILPCKLFLSKSMCFQSHRVISKDPDEETPRRISKNGQLFHSLVWSKNEAKLFMVVSGWMEVSHTGFVIFLRIDASFLLDSVLFFVLVETLKILFGFFAGR